MKKVKLTGKFNLGKETITNLSNDEMNGLNGGGTILDYTCCAGSWNHSSCGGHICGGTTNGRKGCISIAPSVSPTCSPGCGTNTCG